MSALPGAALVASGATHETARLRLRHFEERDLEALAPMYADRPVAETGHGGSVHGSPT